MTDRYKTTKEIIEKLRDLAGGNPINHSGYRAHARDLINKIQFAHPELHIFKARLYPLFDDHFSGKRQRNPIHAEVLETTARIAMLEHEFITRAQ